MAAKMFKPGDRVMVREDLRAFVRYGDIRTNSEMASLAGEVTKIRRIVGALHGSHFYQLEGGRPWHWDDKMLVPVPEEDINDGGYDISDLLEGFKEGK